MFNRHLSLHLFFTIKPKNISNTHPYNLISMKLINIFFLFSLFILLFSCSDSDDLIKGKALIIIHDENVSITNTENSQYVSFETDMNWVAKSSENWCKVYPAIGDSSMKGTTLTVSTNEEDEERSCTITITAGGVSKSIFLKQHGNIYWVKEMGTLGTMLDQTQKETIAKMIVKGEINKADFDVMKKEMPNLTYLDLKDVKCEKNSIPDEAFGSIFTSDINKSLSTIILPQSITKIGRRAFTKCSGLTGALDLPAELTEIGERAFEDCSGFTGTLTLPKGLKKIEDKTFLNCSGLTGPLNLHESLIMIGEQAFEGCKGFTGPLKLPSKLTKISFGAFYDCTGFTGSLTIPDGMKIIELSAFYNCNGLSGSVTFPEGLTEIGNYAFLKCSNIRSFRFSSTYPIYYQEQMFPPYTLIEVPASALQTYKEYSWDWSKQTLIGY